MEKFTKIKKQQEKQIINQNDSIGYTGKYLSVIKENDYEYVTEKDTICCLVYIKDDGHLIMRREPIAPWHNKLKNSDLFLTCISGTIENGETPKQCLRRELYEEAGLVLSEFYQFEIYGPFFKTKGNDSYYYTCVLEINYNDYKLVAAPGDGSKTERLSNAIRISLGDIDDIKCNDMVTKYLLTKLKYDNKI